TGSDEGSPQDGKCLLRVDLEATATTNNARQAVRSLPRRWFLKVTSSAGSLHLQGATTAEARAAEQLVAAPDGEGRRAVLRRHADLDREAILAMTEGIVRDIAQGHASGTTFSQAIDLLDFLVDDAVARGDRVDEATALRITSLAVLEDSAL